MKKKELEILVAVHHEAYQRANNTRDRQCRALSFTRLSPLHPPLLSCSSHANASLPFQQEPLLRRQAFKGLLEFICLW